MLIENVTIKLVISVWFTKLKPPYNENENSARYAPDFITTEIVTKIINNRNWRIM